MKIFISYRRDDSAGWAGRVYDRIAHEFAAENCFMDVEGIQAGENFDEVIVEQVAKADVALVMIGPQWFAPDPATGLRRIDKPGDWVRREIEAALANGATVIPLLVQGAKSPRASDLPATLQELSRKETFSLDMRSFRDDLDRLMPRLQSLDPWRPFKPPEKPPLMDGVWEDILQLHWPVEPASLVSRLPAGFELDTYDGKAWVSLECVRVATGWYRKTPKLLPLFRATGRTLARLPGIKDVSRMEMVAWRTYVSYRGRPGWLLLYVALPSRPGALAVKAYSTLSAIHHRPISFTRTGDERSLRMVNQGVPSIEATYHPAGESFIPRRETLEAFLYFRYIYFSGSPGSNRSSGVEMQFAPWSLQRAELKDLKESFLKQLDLKPLGPPLAYAASRISATVWTPKLVSSKPGQVSG